MAAAPAAAGDAVYLWPCNVAAWNAFMAVQTQWRSGMASHTGLDYAGVRSDLLERGIAAPERRALWPGIKACELAVLDVWGKARERRRQQAPQPG